MTRSADVNALEPQQGPLHLERRLDAPQPPRRTRRATRQRRSRGGRARAGRPGCGPRRRPRHALRADARCAGPPRRSSRSRRAGSSGRPRGRAGPSRCGPRCRSARRGGRPAHRPAPRRAHPGRDRDLARRPVARGLERDRLAEPSTGEPGSGILLRSEELGRDDAVRPRRNSSGPQSVGTVVSTSLGEYSRHYAVHAGRYCNSSTAGAHCASNVELVSRHRRRQEEAVAALPEGLGPGALTARERRPMEPPGPEARRGRGHH